MHYLKRGFRKKQIACRKGCEDAGNVALGGRRGAPRRGAGGIGREEELALDDPVEDDDDASWDGLDVIEGFGSDVGKRPLAPCVARCISPYCYDLEYNRPLEPGEVDERYDFFRKCFTLEAAEARKRERTRLYDEDEDE
ncbi:uncharacterized protein ACA1_229210 [Acanthamoeba castellanii str. Neff]|uniref:Uncharacterized protein n=1 Tax=Acanthamoeba castellanii (strain ATCC 30010 / Neff) TaxID=1257118 RepID=L8H8Z0_ACACF|nr:uncharacterized protein ACA1_229210 [Acanthamoeba castellanii str. Neff]ELR21620.1 hypothetical protein ACA1_229210 [Acanthamoeba castellanii str. Neff]